MDKSDKYSKENIEINFQKSIQFKNILIENIDILNKYHLLNDSNKSIIEEIINLTNFKTEFYKTLDDYEKYSKNYNENNNEYPKEINKFVYFFEYHLHPEYSIEKNFFADIIKNDKVFRTFLKQILQSKCITSYYKDNEKVSYIFSDKNEQTFDDFYEGIKYVPMPKNINGCTECTLLIFINNHSREYENFKFKELEKLVKSFLIILV